MSTQTGAMPDSYPVQWTGRLAILPLPQHVGDRNADQIREQLLWVINRATASGTQLRLTVSTGSVQRVLCLNGLDRLIPVHPSLDAAIAAAAPAATVAVPLQRGGRHEAQPQKPAGYAGSFAEETGPGMGR